MNKSDIVSDIVSWLNEPFICVYCKKKRTLRKSIGRLACRMHTKNLVDNIWQCCLKPYGTIGCVPCDHNPEYYSLVWEKDENGNYVIFDRTIKIEKYYLDKKFVLPKSENILPDPNCKNLKFKEIKIDKNSLEKRQFTESDIDLFKTIKEIKRFY